MRKPSLLLATLLLLSAVGAAASITSPGQGQEVTQDDAVQLEVDAEDTSSLEYRLSEESRERCSNWSSCYLTPEDGIIQGENTLVLYRDGSEDDNITFHVDTEAPRIDARRPTGTVFDRRPTLRILYSDNSSVPASTVDVLLNGTPLDGTVEGDTFTADLGEIDEGTYTVSYNIADEHWRDTGSRDPNPHNATGSWSFTLPVEPVVSGMAPTGTVGADPTLRLTARDPSNVTPADSSIRVTNGNDTREIELTGGPTGTMRITEQLSDLADGTYTVNATISDTNGNAIDESWTFTIDTTPPAVELVSPGAGSIMTGDERVRVDASDALSEVVRVNVSIGDVTVEAAERDDGFTADIDTGEVADGERTVRATAVDAAGNERTVERTVTVDNNAPAIEDVALYPEPAVEGLLVEARAVDDATDVRGVRYTVRKVRETGEDLASGRLVAVAGEYDSRTEDVRTAAPLDLPNGEYAVFLRAWDAAGHASSGTGTQFMVDRGVAPELAAATDGPWTVVAGETGGAAVHVANTGDADEYVRAEVESDLNVSVRPDAERVQEGENRTLTVRLTAGEAEPGSYRATVTLDGFADDATVERDVVVQPPGERQAEIEARYDELREAVDSLNESLRETGIDDENVTGRFADAAAAVAEAEALLEEGRYAAAAEQLAVAGDLVETTESTFTAEVTRVRIATATSVLLKLGALLAVAGLLLVGYLLVPPEEGFDAEQGFVHRPEGKHPLRVRAEYRFERLKEKLRQDEQERGSGRVEGWSGFGD